MSEPELSPLAQKLAESHEVDLSALYGQNPDGKITARNVLEYLSLTSEEAAILERQQKREGKPAKPGKERRAAETQAASSVEPGAAEAVPAREAQEPKTEAPKAEDPEPQRPTAAVRESQKALSQTRSQLQATAMVHQKALMQVGALRQQNEALDVELERLKSKEEAARSFIQELEAKQRTLERELEKSKKKPKPLEWLRKKIF